MNQTVTTQELAIVLAAKAFNPALINPDFLRQTGIVPMEWELASEPLASSQVAQIVFQNGISIAAQPDRIMFVEAVGSKPDTEVQVAEIAQKYVQLLKRVEYQAIGINLRGYVGCPDSADAPRQYLTQTLMKPGSWQEFGTEPMRASLNLSYKMEKGQFVLSINDATLQFPESEALPVMLFSGNFSYDLAELSEDERAQQLSQTISNWQTDLDTYRDLINTKLLAQMPSTPDAVPNLFAITTNA